jgi:hypothetical protein
MATGYLGPAFDIHGGGRDLIFPHHENERVQSGSAGDRFAGYWVHHGLVTVGGAKMSGSAGNALAVSAALRSVRPQELRYYLAQAHYHTSIEYSPGALEDAAAAYQRIERFVTRAQHLAGPVARSSPAQLLSDPSPPARSSSVPSLAAPSLAAPSLAAPSLAAPSLPEPEPEPVAPRPAGLVLIQTGTAETYLYWELERTASTGSAPNGSAPHTDVNGAAALAPALEAEAPAPSARAPSSRPPASSAEAAQPHWVSIVTHVVQGAGSERREHHFPIFQPTGAVRLDGVPREAVVRAKLARGEAPEVPPLVVAGLVWAADPAALARAEARFAPHAAADPRLLAQRAGAHLVQAAPIYW